MISTYFAPLLLIALHANLYVKIIHVYAILLLVLVIILIYKNRDFLNGSKTKKFTHLTSLTSSFQNSIKTKKHYISMHSSKTTKNP